MPNTVGQKMSEYTPLSSLTDEQQRTYLGNAAVTTFGTKEAGGATINVNVPLDEIKPTVPVTDVQVGGTSVLNNGVAEVPAIPDASSLAGTGLTESSGKLAVSSPIPDPGTNEHRGDVLTVDSNDKPMWVPPQGGGGGGYTPVTITPDQSALSGSSLIVNLQNHTLVTLDLSNIDPTAGGQYGVEEISLIAPEVASGDYTDIIVQIKPYNDTDGINPVAYVMESGEPVKLVPTAFMGNSYAKDIWVCVHIIGRMYIRYNEDSDAS